MTRTRKRWQPDEEQALAYAWGTATLATLSHRFGRSGESLHRKASKLGLYRRECWTTLHGVADASGFDRECVIRILRWARVPVLRGASRPPAKKRTLINRDEALAAVEAWCQTETARMAADVRGKSYAWLKRRLVQAGAFVPSFGHRYQTSEIEAAIAGYRKRSLLVGRNQYKC